VNNGRIFEREKMSKRMIVVISLVGAVLVCGVMLAGCEKKTTLQAPEAPKSPAAPTVPTTAEPNKPMAAAEQTMCPVMDGPIDKKLFTEYKGKKVYFCCAGCKEIFEKDPEKYIAKLPQFKK
jgi:YHS domain-containing protein